MPQGVLTCDSSPLCVCVSMFHCHVLHQCSNHTLVNQLVSNNIRTTGFTSRYTQASLGPAFSFWQDISTVIREANTKIFLVMKIENVHTDFSYSIIAVKVSLPTYHNKQMLCNPVKCLENEKILKLKVIPVLKYLAEWYFQGNFPSLKLATRHWSVLSPLSYMCYIVALYCHFCTKICR